MAQNRIGQAAREATGIATTMTILAFAGFVINGEAYILSTLAGWVALGIFFGLFYAIGFAFCVWHYRK